MHTNQHASASTHRGGVVQRCQERILRHAVRQVLRLGQQPTRPVVQQGRQVVPCLGAAAATGFLVGAQCLIKEPLNEATQ